MPRNTASAVEPKAITIEFQNRGTNFDSDTTTMLRARAIDSQVPEGGGRLARYSGVCRERVVKRLQ